jgi:CBS domain-containing protein
VGHYRQPAPGDPLGIHRRPGHCLAGISIAFGADIPFLGSGFVNGLWIAFIGWFLNSAAIQSYQQLVVSDMLHDVPVARLMRSNPPTVSSAISTDDLVHNHVMGTDEYAFPVVDDGMLVGIVTLEDIRAVPRDRWEVTPVRDIMTPTSELVVATPEEDAADALNKLTGKDVRQFPVVSNGRVAGVLRRQDIMRWLQRQSSDVQPI